MNEEIMVSVLCITYNQKKYISDALNSFVNQKTTFKYEILVNDDCSTDGTKEIVEKYAKDYPNLVKPIFHEENQYSKGFSPIRDFLIPAAKGKYIAICEGDDYWICDNKLQLQYDYMESHPKCYLCVHDTFLVDKDKNVIGKVNTSRCGNEISLKDVLVEGGDFIATSSVFAKLLDNKYIPKYFDILTLDYTWQIFFASCGNYTYCFEEPMSVYRQGAEGAWSSLCQKDFEAYKVREKNLLEKKIRMREAFNKENNDIYKDFVEEADTYDTIKCAICTKDFDVLKQKKYKEYIRKLGIKEQLRYFLLVHAPFVFGIYKKIKKVGKHKCIHQIEH